MSGKRFVFGTEMMREATIRGDIPGSYVREDDKLLLEFLFPTSVKSLLIMFTFILYYKGNIK